MLRSVNKKTSPSKISVLIVDDEESVLSQAACQVRDSGCQVFTATSAYEAMEILFKEPDLNVVISDIRMPGTTGVELFLISQRIGFKIPFVLMSTSVPVNQNEFSSLGVSDFIQKPLHRDIIENCIARIIAKNRRLELSK